jgi:proteasome lid subunit RPN8/RPN11
MNEYEEFSPVARKALLECQGYTQIHKVEYCVFLRDDRPVFTKAGVCDAVSFDYDEVYHLKCLRPDLLVHSHPDDASLSLCDLRFANTFNLKIAAITPKGDVYWADGNKVGIAMEPEGYSLGGRFRDISEKIKEPELKRAVEKNWYHMVWSRMKQELGLNYNYQICCDTAEEIRIIKPIFDKYKRCVY